MNYCRILKRITRVLFEDLWLKSAQEEMSLWKISHGGFNFFFIVYPILQCVMRPQCFFNSHELDLSSFGLHQIFNSLFEYAAIFAIVHYQIVNFSRKIVKNLI